MQAAALLFWLYASEGDIDEARRLLPSIPGGVPPGVVAIFAVNAARTDLDRARKLAELIPAPEGRATLFQLILANSPNPPATTAEIDH